MRILITVSLFFAAQLLAQTTHTNMGGSMNSAYSELHPYVTADGKKMFFVRDGHPQNTLHPQETQDIWYCKKTDSVNWENAKHLGFPFNQTQYNTVFYQSPDGTRRVIRGAYKKGQYAGIGYSEVRLKQSGWGDPETMDIARYEKMSKGKYAGICLSPDNQTMILYLSENEKDDNSDLYVSFRNKNNNWSKPLSLGTVINSAQTDESTPFIAADNTTLYFSSNRAGSLGSSDIWMSRRLDDTWTNWSQPVNLGDKVNTVNWDGYYTMSASGNEAYMSTSDPKGFGSSDIVKIELKEEVKPNPVALVTGKVLDAKTRQPVEASISYQFLPGNSDAGIASSAPGTGEYQIVLPYGKMYAFSAKADGYYAISEHLDLTTLTKYEEVKRDLLLVPVEVGQVIRLNNIFFEFGKASLKSESFAELDKAVEFLNGNPLMEIAIGGHTDNVGSDEANLKLSEERAKAVYDYFVSKGIVAARLSSKGYGETSPVAGNDTDAGREQNRRVEFTITKK